MTYETVSIRIAKIRTRTDAGGATRHGRRGKGVKNVKRERSHLNAHWVVDLGGKIHRVPEPINVGQSLVDRAEELKAAFRSNGAIGSEAIIWTGGDYLSCETEMDRLKAVSFAEDAIEAMVKKYGKRVIGARLDLDETSPHVSVFLLPVYVKDHGGELRKSTGRKLSVSHNKVFAGGPDGMARLQDWIAEAMQAAGHDLVRGRPASETGRLHGDQRVYNDIQAEITRLKEENQILRGLLVREVGIERITELLRLNEEAVGGGGEAELVPDTYAMPRLEPDWARLS